MTCWASRARKAGAEGRRGGLQGREQRLVCGVDLLGLVLWPWARLLRAGRPVWFPDLGRPCSRLAGSGLTGQLSARLSFGAGSGPPRRLLDLHLH